MQKCLPYAPKISVTWQGDASERGTTTTRGMKPKISALHTVYPCVVVDTTVIAIQGKPFIVIGRLAD